MQDTVVEFGDAYERGKPGEACVLSAARGAAVGDCERFEEETSRRLDVPPAEFVGPAPKFGDINVEGEFANAELDEPPRRVRLVRVSDGGWRIISIDPR